MEQKQKEKMERGKAMEAAVASKPVWSDWSKLLPKPQDKNDIEDDVGPIEERLDRYRGVYAKMGCEHLNYPIHNVTQNYFNEDFYAVAGDAEL
jgi:hypothetical protein